MYNKFFIIVFILSLLSSCGKNTTPFIIHNNSSWDAVFELNDFKELGVRVRKSNYLIRRKSSSVFEFYNKGTCKLISVNGAGVKTHTNSLMILENTEPLYIKVKNNTGKTISLRNHPCLPCALTHFYEKGYFRVFQDEMISSAEINLKIFAWQLKQCKTADEINSLPILISAEAEERKYTTFFVKNDSNEIILMIQ